MTLKRFSDFIDKNGKVDAQEVKEYIAKDIKLMNRQQKLRWTTVFDAEQYLIEFFFEGD